jgi:predicted methyltransferase
MSRYRRVASVSFVLVLALPFGAASAQEKSVSPGINKPYEKPDVTAAVGRFEKEGRDVYDHREEVVKACGLKPGMAVADIGAGTGLFTRLFSPLVGEQGRVYAVDIAENFVKHIEKLAAEQGLKNVKGVVCDDKSTNLPAASIDLAFTSDTYHHFEFPQKTLESIRQALRPDGRLIIVDYQRIEGESTEWALKHIRAGKEEVTAEIMMAGFKFVCEKRVGLKESYFLVFEKKPSEAEPK